MPEFSADIVAKPEWVSLFPIGWQPFLTDFSSLAANENILTLGFSQNVTTTLEALPMRS
jgi:hypothetical protein